MPAAQNKYRINKDKFHAEKMNPKLLMEKPIIPYEVTESTVCTIYHYTSPEGLTGILKNQNIYFTDCQFLNDSNERLEINNELKTFWWNNRQYYDKEFYNLMKYIEVNTYEDNSFSYLYDREDLCRYFVLSASKNNDSLSLWKYYSKNNTYNGYNIGFFNLALMDTWLDIEYDSGISIDMGLVIYDAELKQAKIQKKVEYIYDIWCKYERSVLLDTKLYNDFKAWISYASLFFKNCSFKSEEEFRFVAAVPKDKLNSIFYDNGIRQIKMYDFRLVDGILIPYLIVPFISLNDDICKAVNSIVVGPSLNSDQKLNGLKQFLNSLNCNPDELSISASCLPLRY